MRSSRHLDRDAAPARLSFIVIQGESAIKRNIREQFLSPAKSVSIWMDSSALVLSGLSSLLVYYLITFDTCAISVCDELTIMRFWVSLAWLFIPYGPAQIGVGVFLAQARELARIHRLSIVASGLLGTVLAGMVVFGVSAEINAIR